MKKYLHVRLFTEKRLYNKRESHHKIWTNCDKLASLKFENSVSFSSLIQKRKHHDEISVSNHC